MNTRCGVYTEVPVCIPGTRSRKLHVCRPSYTYAELAKVAREPCTNRLCKRALYLFLQTTLYKCFSGRYRLRATALVVSCVGSSMHPGLGALVPAIQLCAHSHYSVPKHLACSSAQVPPMLTD